jgi:signal transduction histidine kinase
MEVTQEILAYLKQVAPGNAAIYRLRGRIVEPLYAAAELPALNGMTQAEYDAAAGKNAADTVLPADLPGLMQAVGHLVRTREPLDEYYRVVHKTLGFDWVHAHARYCGEMEGDPVVLVSYTNASVETDSYQNILDRAHTMVYVCDRNTHELLYLNRAAREHAQSRGESFSGRTCFDYVRGRSDVCQACYFKRIRPGEYLTTQAYDPQRAVWESVSGEYIRWCRRDAFVIYLEDVTAAMNRQTELQSILASEQHTVADIQTLSGTAPLGERIGEVLRHMLEYLQADRAYLFELDEGGDSVSNTYEACRSGVVPEIDTLQHVKLEYAAAWMEAFRRREAVLVRDLETIRQTRPEEYGILRRQGIHSYAEAPLLEDGQFIGFLGVDNPAPDKLRHSDEVLMALAYAFSSALLREKSAESLRNSQRRYQLAVGGADLGVWEYHIRQRRLIHPNSRFLRCGVPEVLENFPESLLPRVLPADRDAMLALYRRVDGGEPLVAGDVWMQWQPGEDPVCEHIVYSVTRGPDGLPDVAYGISIDVTAQKQEQQKFRQEMQALLRANPEALGMCHVNLTRNLRGEGHSASHFLEGAGKSLTDLAASAAGLIPAGDARAEFCRCFDREALLADFQAGRTERQLECRRTGEGGRLGWMRICVRMLRNPETEDVEGVAYALDITAEKQQAEILQLITDQEYDFIALVHVSEQTVEAVHLGASLPQAYRELLPRPGAMYGLAAFRRGAMERWLHPDDREKYRLNSDPDYYRPLMDRSGQSEFTLRESFPDKGGETYRRFQHYYLGGDRDTILIIESDVTETYRQQQKDLARERELRRQADAANAAKTEFLSRMSHDIRTPLNGIIGMTYLAQKRELTPEVADCLDKIATSSHFLLGLVNDILDMAKAESGRIELHLEPYRARDFFRYLDAVVAPLCREKHQNFRIEAQPAPNVAAVADPLRVNQVFFNLLSNAVKYTPEGGTIVCRLRERLLGENRVTLDGEIADNGIGMSESFQKVLFDPFTQEGRSDVSEARGSGLGLAIAKKLMDLMGGTIRVESAVGKGTTFFLHAEFDCVPDAGPDAEESARASGGSDTLRGRHILLCEDHPLNQEIARALLEDQGMQVTLAEDGRRGVERFSASAVGYFDAVLMDIRMPVLDGYGAARAIRALERPDAGTVPILAMTADAFADDVQRCLQAGMNGHIPKPIDPEVLCASLRAALDTGKTPPPQP